MTRPIRENIERYCLSLRKRGLNSSFFWTLFFLGRSFFSILADHPDTLIVNYATAHLNSIPSSVCGVLLTPSGLILTTGPLDPYSRDKIVISPPEIGKYSAYFEALTSFKPRICYVVGGIEVNLCNQPNLLIPFLPARSHVQAFESNTEIKKGAKTMPIATFLINWSLD